MTPDSGVTDLQSTVRLYLVLIEVCNDDSDEQSESNHASQEHEDVNVDAVDLQTQSFIGSAG